MLKSSSVEPVWDVDCSWEGLEQGLKEGLKEALQEALEDALEERLDMEKLSTRVFEALGMVVRTVPLSPTDTVV